MRYYIRDPEQNAITGPFDLDEIEAKLDAGELPVGTLATGDTGKGIPQIQHAPAEDWMPLESIPGLSGERQAGSKVPPPPPPPLPPQNGVTAPPSPSSGMAFCPACGHKLAPDVGSVCDRCGKNLIVIAQTPTKPLESKPEPLLPKVAKVAVGIGGCLLLVLLVLGGILLFGFLLLLNFLPTCKA